MSFQKLQTRIVEWRDNLEGNSLEGAINHLIEEAEDLKTNPYDPLSLADVGILWLSICDYAGFTMEEMKVAIDSKQAINESKEWLDADDKGVIRHSKTKI